MDFALYLRIFKRRWKSLVAFIVIALVAGVVYLILAPKTYTATTTIFVSIENADPTVGQLQQSNNFTSSRVQSYIRVAKSAKIAQPVVDDKTLQGVVSAAHEEPLSLGKVRNAVTITAPPNEVIVQIAADSPSPKVAAALSFSYAKQFQTYVPTLETGTASTTTAADGTTTKSSAPSVKMTVTQPAEIPNNPSSPRRTITLVGALVAGLLLGVGLMLYRELSDNTAKDPELLQEWTNLPNMGVVPFDRSTRDSAHANAFRSQTYSARAEAFRQIRSSMNYLNVSRSRKVIALTSALPGEGKTHAAINLASSLAEANHRVCLVETDLRRPTVAKLLGLLPGVGLTTVLVGEAELEQVLQNAGQNLAVLTAGELPPNPSELLSSDAMHDVLAALSEAVDYVVLDTAPILPVADGLEVCSLADAVLLVVRSGKTTHEQTRTTLANFERVGVTPSGTILSMAKARGEAQSEYYYYSAHNTQQPEKKSRRQQRAEAKEAEKAAAEAVEVRERAAAEEAETATAAEDLPTDDEAHAGRH